MLCGVDGADATRDDHSHPATARFGSSCRAVRTTGHHGVLNVADSQWMDDGWCGLERMSGGVGSSGGGKISGAGAYNSPGSRHLSAVEDLNVGA